MNYLYLITNRKALLTSFLLLLAGGLWAQAGIIDSTYGNNGLALIDIDAGSTDYPYSVVVQPDGKAVVAGYSEKGGHYNAVLIRLLEDGSPDPGFGAGGVVLSDLGSDGRFYAVALDENQNIIAGGYSSDGDFAIARYLPDGSPDESFGTNGMVITDLQNDFENINALVLQTDGKIVAAGASAHPDNPGGAAFALIRYNSDGSPDATFGDQGKVFTEIGPGWDDIWSMVIQADGKLLVGGETEQYPYWQLCMARYNSDGTLDSSFGSDGIVVDTFNNGHSAIRWMDLSPNGKITIVGRADPSQIVARYNADGTPDNAFNGTGKLIIDPAVGCNGLYSGLLMADGKVVIGGTGHLSSNSQNFLAGRINPDGSVDTTFGENGFLERRITFGSSGIYSLASTPDGNLIAAGYGFDELAGISSINFAVVKYLNDLQVGTLNFENPVQAVLVYPNPIVNEAMLRYDLEAEQRITIRLLDPAGRILKTFVRDQWQVPGRYQQPLAIPSALPPGLYLIQISSPQMQVSIKVVK